MTLALTEKRNPNSVNIDLMSSLEIVQVINNEDKKVALAVEKVLPHIASAVDMIADAFLKGGRLAYFGAGTSGRLGVLDASECWPTFGVEHGMVCGFIAGGDKALRYSVENAEDSQESGLTDLMTFNPTCNDIIVGISAGGNAPYVLAVLEKAQNLGCKTIGISSNPKAKLAAFSDVFINPIVGEEVITGSSRMKSGTAQKMILNMLSTASMIRIGKTYENYMVDVRTMNAKLTDRATRIVSEIAKIPYETAGQFLVSADYRVKTACVMAVKNVSKEEAVCLLNQNGGILKKALL